MKWKPELLSGISEQNKTWLATLKQHASALLRCYYDDDDDDLFITFLSCPIATELRAQRMYLSDLSSQQSIWGELSQESVNGPLLSR